MNKPLTNRQKELLKAYIEDCLSVTDLAARFNLHRSTVKNTLVTIRNKSGMSTALELARWAILNGYAEWATEQLDPSPEVVVRYRQVGASL